MPLEWLNKWVNELKTLYAVYRSLAKTKLNLWKVWEFLRWKTLSYIHSECGLAYWQSLAPNICYLHNIPLPLLLQVIFHCNLCVWVLLSALAHFPDFFLFKERIVLMSLLPTPHSAKPICYTQPSFLFSFAFMWTGGFLLYDKMQIKSNWNFLLWEK